MDNEKQKREVARLIEAINREMQKMDVLLEEIREYRVNLHNEWEVHKLTVNISLN